MTDRIIASILTVCKNNQKNSRKRILFDIHETESNYDQEDL